MALPIGWVTIENQSVGFGFREEIKKSLTIVGRVTSSFQEVAPCIQLYEEGDKCFAVPRGYYNMYLRNRGVDGSFNWSIGSNDLLPADPISLRPGQPELVDGVVAECTKNPFGGAIIHATVGAGKTVMGLECIRRLGLKALVLAPTSVLIDQWIKEIPKFMPHWRVGRLQADKIDIDNKDIVVGTLQSAALKEYQDYIYKSFGTILIDENHLANAMEFSNCLKKFNAKYLIGCTGTLNRADRLETVFHYSSGKIVHAPKAKSLEPVVYFIDTKFSHVFRSGIPLDRQTNKYLEKATDHPARNEMIIKQAERAALSKRNVLILTKRVNHAKLLQSHLSIRLKPHGLTCGLAVGEMKSGEREKSYTANIIVATTQLIATGFNEPRLDTLIMATPMGGNTLTQGVGRIRRLHDNKKTPFVLDLVDSKYQGAVISAKARFESYLNNGWLVHGYEVFEKEYLCQSRIMKLIEKMKKEKLSQ